MSIDKLLGETLESKPIKAWLNKLGAKPSRDEDDSRVFLDDPERGILIRAEPRTRKATAIYVYFTGYEGYKEYAGDLPLGLRSDMGRADLELLLGPGRDPTGKGRKLVWDSEDSNVSIEFLKDGRIRQIAFYT
jgi:hypothetical protein